MAAQMMSIATARRTAYLLSRYCPSIYLDGEHRNRHATAGDFMMSWRTVGVVAVGGMMAGAAAVYAFLLWREGEFARKQVYACIDARDDILSRLRDPIAYIDSSRESFFLGIRRGSFYALWQACRASGVIRAKDEQDAFVERDVRERTMRAAAFAKDIGAVIADANVASCVKGSDLSKCEDYYAFQRFRRPLPKLPQP